jgi:hypothetical protein
MTTPSFNAFFVLATVNVINLTISLEAPALIVNHDKAIKLPRRGESENKTIFDV